MNPRRFDDFVAGDVFDLGTIDISQDDIIAFARDYDPQPFHTDPVTADISIYGGLIASGWQTACLFMRLLASNLLNESLSLGSGGLDDLRWLAPVRPGDRLTASIEIMKTRVSSSKPDRGIVTWRGSMTNQDAVVVMTIDATFMIGTGRS